MNEQDVQKLVEQASPNDGFGIQDVVSGKEHSLHLVFRVNGVAVDLPWMIGPSTGHQVWAKKNLSDADYGEKARLRLLLLALCRYLNTGGEPAQLEHVLDDVFRCAGQLRFDIPGYHLIDSAFTDAGTYEHLFARDNSPYAIRWVEGEYFDVVSLTDIANGLRAEEQAEADE